MQEYWILGPPGCISVHTKLFLKEPNLLPRLYDLEDAFYKSNKDNVKFEILSLVDNKFTFHPIEKIIYSNVQHLFRVKTKLGNHIDVTEEHPFRVAEKRKYGKKTKDHYIQCKDLKIGNFVLCNFDGEKHPPIECEIISIQYLKEDYTFDIIMKEPHHNYVANNFVVHNTGKTTRLATREIPRAVAKYGPDKVLITSFSRTAAREIASKKSIETGQRIPVNPDMVGTLHSLCYHALGMPKLVNEYIDDWNDSYPNYMINKSSIGSIDETTTKVDIRSYKDNEGTRILNEIDILRAKMIEPDQWNPMQQDFFDKWKDFKEKNFCYDFTDLIEVALKTKPYGPGRPKVIFVDEAQDMTKLQLSLVRSWGVMAEWFILVFDDDQCQPAGEMVLTTNGYKDISLLDESKDKLACFARKDGGNIYLGNRTKNHNGFSFKKAKRLHKGDMYTINTSNKQTKATSNHIWYTKWSKEAKKTDTNIVYLMNKGVNYRIGWCQLIRSDGTFHLGVRCRQEKADKAWILKVCDSKKQASLWESYFAAEYGITTAPFKPLNNRGYYTEEVLKKLYFMLSNKTKKANTLLKTLNKSILFPLWEKDKTNKGGSSIFLTRTCNLEKNIMMLPTQIKTSAKKEWNNIDDITINKNFNNHVYSLEVEKHNSYIVNGIVTHNCIFSFTGCDPKALLASKVPNEFKKILDKSYRVPQAVHEKAMEIISNVSHREPKAYKPRDYEGEVRYIDDNFKEVTTIVEEARQHIENNETVMFMASCDYMLNDLKSELRENGLPFHNPYRLRRADWNPLRSGGNGNVTATDLISCFVGTGTDNEYWTVHQLVTWAQYLRVGEEGLVRKMGKKGIQALKTAIENNAPGLHTSRNVIDQILNPKAITPALKRNTDWLMENLNSTRSKTMQYPMRVYEKNGLDYLRKEPMITIGTIHSFKGSEADHCYLFPDISAAAAREAEDSIESKDALYRLFYVAATRAKMTLTICSPASKGGKFAIEL